MKTPLFYILTVVMLFLTPFLSVAQAPDMGSTADFVLFTTDGPVDMTSTNHLTGNVGTNNGTSTNFNNLNGQLHDADGTSAQCAIDLLDAYNELNSTVADYFPSSLLGNGDTLTPGVYSISSAASLNLTLILDAQNDPDAEFIFQIGGPLSTKAGSKVKLINGTLACNVFWKVEGLVDMATGTSMRGTIIANNAAIIINSGSTLEGRALSTTGAITVDGILGYTPVGCGSPSLSGPNAPALGAAACFAIFSSDGDVSNSGISTVTGDIGSNSGSTTGFDSLLVTGNIHPSPDVATSKAANDLSLAYTHLNKLDYDIELLYPVKLGSSLVLTPHTYLLDGAAHLTDTLYLNGQGNPDAVFVIQINGALTTSTYSKVLLTNGTQAKNVFWKIEGAVTINNYSTFNGTIICNNGALGAVNTGVALYGRLLTTAGDITTMAITAAASSIPGDCEGSGTVGISAFDTTNEEVEIYPNPFSSSISIRANHASQENASELKIYNALGEKVMTLVIRGEFTAFDMSQLPSGLYFYHIQSNGQTTQSGTLIAAKR